MKRILDYLNDNLGNKERYILEKDMSSDPFLSDAMDGFATLDASNLQNDLNTLQNRLKKKQTHTRKLDIKNWIKIAASIIILIGIISVSLLLIIPRFVPTQLAKQESAEKASENQLLEPTSPAIMKQTEENTSDSNKKTKPKVSKETVIDDERTIAPITKEKTLNIETKNEALTKSESTETIDILADHDMDIASVETENVETIQEQRTVKNVGATPKLNKENLTNDFPATTSQTIRIAKMEENEAAADQENFALNEMDKKNAKARKKSAQSFMVAPSELSLSKGDTATGFPIRHVEITYKNTWDKNALPNGGTENFKHYILDKKTKRQSNSNRVSVEFVIDTTGRFIAIKVDNTNDIYANELIRLLKEGPKWSPAIQDSVPINDSISISVIY